MIDFTLILNFHQIKANFNFKFIIPTVTLLMNIELPAHPIWAKLVAIQPGNENIAMSTDRTECPFADKFIIYQNQDGQTLIQNLSAPCLCVDDSLLEINQEKQLFGGEKLSFGQDNDHINPKCDYVFCFVNFQPGLKRDRDRDRDMSLEFESVKKLDQIENDLQKELTCSICTNHFEKCMTLSPCLHSFCSFCLFDHLKLSNNCSLCRVEVVSVAKSPVLSNVIQLAIDHFPAFQESLERKELEEINFGGVIVKNAQGVYIGSYIGGKKEGQGKMTYRDGEIYEGSWRNDKREGKGRLVLKNGDKYDGNWMNDRYNGFGKYIWSFGGEHEGNFQDSVPHGYGIRKWKDGGVYKGDWKMNKREGKGVMVYTNGDEYEGDLKNDCRYGYGVLTYTDGKVYKGSWRNDKREGKGILILENGDECKGKWANDVLQPEVTIKYSTGEIYQGEIKVESFKRPGKEIEIESLNKHGKGTLTLQNGTKHRGNWKSETIHKRLTF